MLLQQDHGNNTHHQVHSPSDDLKLAKEAAAQSLESLKVMVGEMTVAVLDGRTCQKSSQMSDAGGRTERNVQIGILIDHFFDVIKLEICY